MTQPSWIGQTLGGRYTIESLLGQGGMSSVYRATDPNLRRSVAVKLIHSHLTGDPAFVRRFEAEAAAVAQLRHPNIIQVFDFNHDGDTYYMVLEFVPGETLHNRLARLAAEQRRLPPDELVRIGASVAEAIDYAHQQGLLHRDIKPANVMLTPQGQAVLMDFGIAKIMGSAAHTATGTVVGTAQYVSPEQVRGQRPTERSDIYSLGVTLFEMAAGRPPFDGDSAMSIMLKHINEPVPDLRALSPGIPPALAGVIQRSLAKEPDSRFRSGGDLAGALRQSLLRPAVTERPAAPARPAAQATIIEPMMAVPLPPPRRSEMAPAPVQAPPAGPPPPIFKQQPAPVRPPAPAPVAPPAPRRSAPTALLIGVPIGLIVCVVLAVVGTLAYQNLFGAEATPTAAPTAAPTDIPATDVPTQPVVETTATAPVEPTAVVVDVTAGMILINGGDFQMGSDLGQPDEQPIHGVRLSPYYLDPFEVTNGRYQACVNDGICPPPAQAGSFTRAAYFGVADFAEHPVLGIPWDQAVTFCHWDGGKRLPTEAEWEFAATGGDGRRYPWGTEFDGTLLPTTSNDTTRVGSFPGGASPFGIHDLAGNVLEWVGDIYDSLFYAESGDTNPTGPDFGDERVLRGGSFGNPDGQFYTTTRRYHLAPTAAEVDVGFRCAFTAP